MASHQTRTKVVQNNLSKGCYKIRKSESKKAMQPLHIIHICILKTLVFNKCFSISGDNVLERIYLNGPSVIFHDLRGQTHLYKK